MNSAQVREKILSSSTPLILKNTLHWNVLHWSLEQWKEALKNEDMDFRIGYFKPTIKPQWETVNKTVKGNFDLFLDHIRTDDKSWLYFDYKYLNSFLLNAGEFRNVCKSNIQLSFF